LVSQASSYVKNHATTPREAHHLTLEIVYSGDLLDLSTAAPGAVDKHSTSGVGDYVESNTTLVMVYAKNEQPCAAAEKRLLAAHIFSDEPIEPYPLFYRRVSSSDILGRRGMSTDLPPVG
jgi:thymidine phosphorylase